MVRSENPVTPPGNDPGTVRLVAQRLNHYATPGPQEYHVMIINHKCTRQEICSIMVLLLQPYGHIFPVFWFLIRMCWEL